MCIYLHLLTSPLQAAEKRWEVRGPEIIGILKERHNHYILDLDSGAVTIIAKSLAET